MSTELTPEIERAMDVIGEVAERQLRESTLRTVTADSSDPTCLSHWFPKIQTVVPVPRTHILTLGNGWDLAALIDGQPPKIYLECLTAFIQDAANDVGWPAFLRTGLTSGKHRWADCCYLKTSDDIHHCIFGLVEHSGLCGMLGLPHDVWCVREMLPVAPVFRCAAYGGMPVVREWRYFVDGARVLYGNPYWPAGALKDGHPDDPNWRERLPELDADPGTLPRELASLAGAAIGGRWSVDLLSTDRGWYVTDMAVAEQSYGWDESRIGT